MKPIKNRREQEFQLKAVADGWKVYHKGYPDFLLYKENENKIKFVEIKRHQKRKTIKMGLSTHQQEVIDILRKAGLDVEVIYLN